MTSKLGTSTFLRCDSFRFTESILSTQNSLSPERIYGCKSPSSDTLIPLLTEIFVSLFRSGCFSSLSLNVLSALEEGICVEKTIHPYRLTYASWTAGRKKSSSFTNSLSLSCEALPTCGTPGTEDHYRTLATSADNSMSQNSSAAKQAFSPTSSIDLTEDRWKSRVSGSKIPLFYSSRKKITLPFFTSLPLKKSFLILDKQMCMGTRRHIPPSFHEVRHIVNFAQVMSSRKKVKLVSLDGDETLYPDGQNFSSPSLAQKIYSLMLKGVNIAIVTAAGYGYQSEKYHQRLQYLFDFFKSENATRNVLERFFVMGGESNYLLRLDNDARLVRVNPENWHMYKPQIDENEARSLLDHAEKCLKKFAEEFSISGNILRKERAVGIVPIEAEYKSAKDVIKLDLIDMHHENLEEIVIRLREAITEEFGDELSVPYCVFNGGRDVWLDIGNKAQGLFVFQCLFKLHPDECLHIGDQFSDNGNDFSARLCSPTIWICNPSETECILQQLLLSSDQIEIQEYIKDL